MIESPMNRTDEDIGLKNTSMTLEIKLDAVPLRIEPDGTVRVGNTRVTLDVMLTAYKLGFSAEEIAEQFDTLELCDVHSIIGYYLRRRDEVEEYLKERTIAAAALRLELERRFPSSGLRERLMARRAGGRVSNDQVCRR